MQLSLARGGALTRGVAGTTALVLALSVALLAAPGRGTRAELFALLAFILLKSLAQAFSPRAARDDAT